MVSISREELQRDRRARLIKRGVTERGKLQELYSGRRAELEAAQERVRGELRTEWDHRCSGTLCALCAYRPTALVSLAVNLLQLYLNVNKKVHLRVHVNLQMKITFMLRFM